MTEQKLDRLYPLLERAVKSVGSYDPDECMWVIEEQLDSPEYQFCRGFLRWLHESGLQFGHGNFAERVQEFQEFGG